MPPAARVGDITSHGTPLSPGPGSANVLIEGMPAWRVGSDFHACPLISEEEVPHVGGVVASGSSTVLINNLPAARQGDDIIEVDETNSISIGSNKVLIG